MTFSRIWRRKNKLTEDHPPILTKINIVAEIVSSSVMVISERCTCEMKKENQNQIELQIFSPRSLSQRYCILRSYMSGLTRIKTDALVTLTQTEQGRINRLLRKDWSLRSAFNHFAMYTAFTLISSLSYPSSAYILV